jgi:flagellar L-ring protein precursor FlgH
MSRFTRGLTRRAGLLAALLGSLASAHATSLYTPGTYQALTSDNRQRHAGDLVTVMVYESSSATSTANTSVGREADIGFDIRAPGKSYAGAVRANNSTDGRGQTVRAGRVLAQITVPIRAITERGDLIIAGEQMVEINNEKQTIKLEGQVRPQDISDANIVLSTRVANARISYVGQGDLADKQRPGWWQRFLTLFGI